MDFNDNLSKLRSKIKNINADAILVSMSNFFGNFKSDLSGIRYISGFSGSNGRTVVSEDKAVLSVDGRYVKQATDQTDSSIWDIKMYPEFDTNKIISDILKNGQTLAIGAFSITYKSYLATKKLADKIGFELKVIGEYPLISHEKSDSKIYLMNESDTGETRQQRIKKIQETLSDAESLLLTDSAALGWIFGVRIDPTEDKCVLPNCVAFIQKDKKPILFCDLDLDATTQDFEFVDISKFENIIKNQEKSIVNLDFSRTSLYFPESLQKNGFSIKSSIVNYGMFESVKNETEIKNLKIASGKASLSFIKTLAFAENIENSSEIEIAEFFESDLKRYDNFVSLSFNSISSFGKNTSIVHYNPKVYGNSQINSEGLFLFDAGAHFSNSTTDMTRTIYRGSQPSEELKKIYSAVLRSVIIFSSMRFPDKSKACYLDSIARFFIWNKGYDYHFGTGHGIGSFGNVHEHPRISPTSLEEITKNMVVTIEPGIYNEDFGIRLENMLLTKPSDKEGFIDFETLNYIPYCRKLIIKTMFSNFELEWLNRYHKSVYKKFADSLKEDSVTLNWLKENTEEI